MTERSGDPHPWVQEHSPGIYMVMGDTAEVVAKRYKISREAQDEYSLLSQQRTARAQQEGFFEGEIAPMKVTRATARQENRRGERDRRSLRRTRTNAIARTPRSKDCSR